MGDADIVRLEDDVQLGTSNVRCGWPRISCPKPSSEPMVGFAEASWREKERVVVALPNVKSRSLAAMNAVQQFTRYYPWFAGYGVLERGGLKPLASDPFPGLLSK